MWTWALPVSAAAVTGSLSVLLGKVSNTNWATLPALGVLVVGGAVWYLLRLRSQRERDREAIEPAPSVLASPVGGSTTLPYTSGFTGRDEELAEIVKALTTEHAVAVVGRRGVGTSSCAVQAANVIRQTAARDQIYYLNLRAGGRPRGARWVLAELAWAMGTPPPRSRRPAALSETAAALRERLDDEHILLVLDNVDSPDQVRPLLPPTSRCRLLLAGTPALEGLDGVAVRGLAEPDPDDAVEMFSAAGRSASVASRRRADPTKDPAVRDIVELCGRQPRAIRALGYRMARHGWSSADMVALLRAVVRAPAHHRLPVTAALAPLTDRDVAYLALSRGARRLLRLLALAPAALDRPAIRALARRSGDRLDRLLDELVNHVFVDGSSGDRYEVRPLLRGYARLHLRREESTGRRVAALTRLLRMLARRAERHVAVIGQRLPGAAGVAGLPTDDDPYGWFELHGDLLRAAVVNTPGGDRPARPMPRRLRRWWFRLAVALAGWYAHEGKLDEWAEVCRAVLAAPTAGDRPEIAGWAHNELGVLRRRRGDPQGAATALALALAARGRRVTAQAQMNLGLALLDLGLADDATEHLELARRHRSHADRGGQALTELALGAAYLAKDEPEAAHHYLVRAANAFRTLGETRGYAAALTNLVLAQTRLGEHLDAAQSWTAALREYDDLADPAGRSAALLNAGAAMLTSAPGRAGQAYELLDEGQELRRQRRPDAGLGRTLLYLGDAARLLGHLDKARRHWADAAQVCDSVGDSAGAAAAYRRLAGPDPA
ncbi:BTAD domain-containing putative transcriptional regulator [Rugosimonospora acidiphila]|uniref:BTAD domain-containing putative transcriptional regulator n=1 Tax=Rugosimonospora acidiphila TaxID=556531 RepID=A0ABP9SN96_9ACTN